MSKRRNNYMLEKTERKEKKERKKRKDVKVTRDYIEPKNYCTSYAFDKTLERYVHVREAFNGSSHGYVVYTPEGEEIPVGAYQGKKYGWHFRALNSLDRRKVNGIGAGVKHELAVEIIKRTRSLRVNPLTFASDTAINYDFEGFKRPVYANQNLYNKCTLIADEVRVDSSIIEFGVKYRPDVLFIINNEYYAIEVIDTHGLFPELDDDESLLKMQAYFKNHINVIVVRITDMDADDIYDGKFTGEWYLSNYAQRCFKSLYSLCKHSYVKDADGYIVDNINDGYEVCNCYKTKDSNGSYGGITVALCKECQKAIGTMYFAFKDRDRSESEVIDDDGNKKVYFYPYFKTRKNSGNLCIHCFKLGESKEFRSNKPLTLPNVVANFHTSFGHAVQEFDKRYKLYMLGVNLDECLEKSYGT